MTEPSALLLSALGTEPGSAPLSWLVARVISVQTDTLTINYRGGNVAGVPYLQSYAAPAAGDMVHVLASEDNGLLVLGRERPRTESALAAPGAAVVVATSGTGSWRKATKDLAGIWTLPTLIQNPGWQGATAYNAASLAAQASLGELASLEILLTLDNVNSGAYEMTLHDSLIPSGALHPLPDVQPYFYQATPGIAEWVPLPLAWASSLISGIAKGIAFVSDIHTMTATGGNLRFTPL